MPGIEQRGVFFLQSSASRPFAALEDELARPPNVVGMGGFTVTDSVARRSVAATASIDGKAVSAHYAFVPAGDVTWLEAVYRWDPRGIVERVFATGIGGLVKRWYEADRHRFQRAFMSGTRIAREPPDTPPAPSEALLPPDPSAPSEVRRVISLFGSMLLPAGVSAKQEAVLRRDLERQMRDTRGDIG